MRASEHPSGNLVPIAPVEFESPVGQLLAQILQTHPHLLPATVDQQLEYLESDRDAHKKEASSAAQDLLYKSVSSSLSLSLSHAHTNTHYSMFCFDALYVYAHVRGSFICPFFYTCKTMIYKAYKNRASFCINPQKRKQVSCL